MIHTVMWALIAGYLLLVPPCVLGHGFLMVPISRNFGLFLDNKITNQDNVTQGDWTINELNGGGISFISHNNTIPWPEGRASVCGDPWNAKFKQWMQPGRVRATYRAGDIINITAVPTTNHEGFYEFRICPLDAKDATGCRLLDRADGLGPRFYLPPPQCCDNRGRMLVPSYLDPFANWTTYPYNDEWRDIYMPTLSYKVPDDLTCKHCMLQWYWLTGHRCVPRCEPANPYHAQFPQTCDPSKLGFCGVDVRQYPEEFWNCADVSILSKGATLPEDAVQLPYTEASLPVATSATTQEPNVWYDADGRPHYHNRR